MPKRKLDKYEMETDRAVDKAIREGTLKSAPQHVKDSLIAAAKANVRERLDTSVRRFSASAPEWVLQRIEGEATFRGNNREGYIRELLVDHAEGLPHREAGPAKKVARK